MHDPNPRNLPACGDRCVPDVAASLAVASAVAILASTLLLPRSVDASDWPQFRHDAERSGTSPEDLPAQLHLQWAIELPAPRPAWPVEQEKLQFDRLYEPVLAGGLLFVPSMVEDKLTAHDAATGEERWTFRAEGPIRLAAAAWRDRVFFVSDDGYLYSLEAATGKLLWKFRGGPSDRKIIGQGRIISTWPARGAPVVRDGIVYFAAGIWPFMGIFIHALDAESGAVIWSNTGTGAEYRVQQHDSSAFAGVAPQGYLAATEEYLVVSGGRTVPAVFERKTGRLLNFDVQSRAMGIKGGGGYEVIAGRDFFLNRGFLYRMSDGRYVAPVSATVMSDLGLLGADKGALRCWSAGWSEEATRDARGNPSVKLVVTPNWRESLREAIGQVFIRCGGRAYASGTDGNIMAVDLPVAGAKPRVSWSEALVDTPLNMVAGDGRLFVSTDRGRIYCFGAKQADVKLEAFQISRLVPAGSVWRYFDKGGEPGEGWKLPDFDDTSWKSGKAQLGYGDGDEATLLSFGPDPSRKPAACYFRRAFEVEREIERLTLRLLVDDGAVVYLNGSEVARLNMPEGDAQPETLASRAVEGDRFEETRVAAQGIRPGRNVLAVEVHQADRKSSDLSFDLELSGVEAPVRRRPRPPGDGWTGVADEVLQASGVHAGYCIAIGLGTGRLVEEVALRSDLHAVAFEPDPSRVARFRERASALGIHGSHVAAVTGNLLESEVAPYLADLVIAEEASELPMDGPFAEEVFRLLRPFTGVACLPLSEEQHRALEVAAPALDGASVERSGRFTLLRRTRAPRGSANWTHQYADAANTVASRDMLVKAPLGLLWFGGPSHDGVLPRHGHGPTPQVVDGRLVIEGRDMLRTVDIYTGRLLWERRLEGIGAFYDYVTHEPGANAIGSNYISMSDGIYAVWGRKCLRLDPDTGATISEIQLSEAPAEEEAPELGYVAAWEDMLVLGAEPSAIVATSYGASDLGGLPGATLERALRAIETWRDFERVPRLMGQKVADYLAANFNRLLGLEDMVSHVPADVRATAGSGDLEREHEAALRDPGRAKEARVIRRKLLSLWYKMPEMKERPPGSTGSFLRIGSGRLFGLDRATGRVLWERGAERLFRHNAVALGGGKAFAIDRLPPSSLGFARRRGLAIDDGGKLLALDVRTGAVVWETTDDVFGTWLGFSEERDILLQAGSSGRDRLPDEPKRGLAAFEGSTGRRLWKSEEEYGGPCLIIGDWVITQVTERPGFALDLRTGERRTRPHPISGRPTPWEYGRNYGCNTALGCPGLLTFRSAAAGFYDLDGDGGTGNLGGFRSGCTSSLVPAGGVLSAPDYTRTCTCSYQNQVSLALVPMPEAEMWTFFAAPTTSSRAASFGINFGAPGDRRGPDGALWLEYPASGGPSPTLRVEMKIEKPVYLRTHTSGMDSGGLPWVAASAIEGSGEISIRLVPESGRGKDPESEEGVPYTVRLVFAELDDLGPGDRVFDVSLQGQVRIPGLDVVKVAGGPRREVVREFRDVPVKGDLRIGLERRSGREPILCGVEVIARARDF